MRQRAITFTYALYVGRAKLDAQDVYNRLVAHGVARFHSAKYNFGPSGFKFGSAVFCADGP